MYKNTTTIITANYNGEKYIEETIQSVVGQSDKDFEYILFDALSNDNSKKIIEKYKKNINVIRYKEDNGLYDAVDQAIKISKGNIIIWLNSDDILHKDAVKNVKEIFKYDNDINWISGVNSYIKKGFKFSLIPYYYPKKIIKHGYAHHNYWGFIQQESIAFKKKLYLKSGGLKPQYGNAGDYHLWKTFSNVSSLKSFNVKIGYFRSWKGQNSKVQRDKYFNDTKINKSFYSLRIVRFIISLFFFPYYYFLTKYILKNNKK
jgi:glycosyltransferase involved in cell wall biosynthesis